MKDLRALTLGLITAIAAPLITATAGAQSVDKSGDHLLNPTPHQHMRPMSPDRPDTTESPYTVDAGHVQIEASFVDYSFDDRTGANEKTETWVFGATNLKLGLTHNIDLQFVFDAWTDTNTFDETGAGGSSRAEGFGDVQLRAKINLFGNDSGDWAMAVMPWIQLPVGDDDLSSDHVEGGLIVPLATQLPGGWSLGVMGEVDFVYDDADGDYDTELLHTLALGHDIVGDLAGYVEYIGVLTTDSETDYIAALGVGLTLALNDDVQLDAGANFGLTRSADDVQVFTGMTWRF